MHGTGVFGGTRGFGCRRLTIRLLARELFWLLSEFVGASRTAEIVCSSGMRLRRCGDFGLTAIPQTGSLAGFGSSV